MSYYWRKQSYLLRDFDGSTRVVHAVRSMAVLTRAMACALSDAGSSRECCHSITRSSNPDVTECSSPSVRRNARDQLAACTFARLPAT